MIALHGAPAVPPAPPFTPQIPELRVLPCGLELWALPRPGLPLVSVRLCVAGGSTADPSGRSGLAALTDATLSRGAGARDALAFAGLTERLALGFSVSTSARATTIGFDARSAHLDTALDLLADVARRPRLEEGEIERVRALRLGELKEDLDDADELARMAVYRAFYGEGHPAAHLPRGDAASVAAATLDEIRASWAARACPGRALLVASGDLRVDELAGSLQRRLEGWTDTSSAPPPLPPPLHPRRRLIFVDRPASTQTVLALLASAPSARDPGLHATRLAALALGGTFTSRLNTRLREEKGYTYGVAAQLLPGPEHGLLSIRTAVQREPTADALRDLLEVTWGIREGVSELELQSARLARVTQLVSALESRSGVADSTASLWEAGRPMRAFHDEIPALQAETCDSVRQAAQRIDLERAAVIVVGDLSAIRAEVEAAVPGDWTLLSPATGSSSAA